MGSRRLGEKYDWYVSGEKYDSTLEIRTGLDPFENAQLTIRIKYKLIFADSKNPVRGIVKDRANGTFLAIDSNHNKFPIKDWDLPSKTIFQKRFMDGVRFWNKKFLLEPPHDYADLDYKNFDNWIIRPNILCLLELKETDLTYMAHLPLTVVRLDSDVYFRANSELYNDNLTNSSLWHEMGHALSQLHIQTLAGTKIGKTVCVANPEKEECYITPAGMGGVNIMGLSHIGSALHPVNARAWLLAIEKHTYIPRWRWAARLSTSIPAKKIKHETDEI